MAMQINAHFSAFKPIIYNAIAPAAKLYMKIYYQRTIDFDLFYNLPLKKATIFMLNRNFFFEQSRSTLFGGKLRQSQTDGLNAILDEWESNHKNKDDRWLAYMLATTHHETDRTMRPIEEYGKGRTRPYGKNIKQDRTRYFDTPNLFYGRGFVQLTWYENYQKAGKKIGVDLIKRPELTLELKYATAILFAGMMEGWFTSRKLSNYFNQQHEDWRNARKIINGTDKAELIADYGKKYYASISYTI